MEIKDKIINELKKIKRNGIDNLITWLEKTGFFTAPASTRFHSNNKGGLAEHSWNVFTLLKEKEVNILMQNPTLFHLVMAKNQSCISQNSSN